MGFVGLPTAVTSDVNPKGTLTDCGTA
jgi:hypothetical protein